MADCCKQGNELPGFIESREIIDNINKDGCRLLLINGHFSIC
jgi:hypothetical protein